MPDDTYAELERLVEADPRYRVNAYLFVMAALDETMRAIEERRHLTGQELCEGIRRLALRDYGMMAKTVLESWGCHTTRDFGNIVYNMIGIKLMSKTEQDRLEDFDNVYDFGKAFVQEYKLSDPSDKSDRSD